MTTSGPATPGADPEEVKRGLRNVWLDDLDRSNLPVIQRDALRRIGSHADPDGSNSFPSYKRIGEEIGGVGERSIRHALRGRPSRRLKPVIGLWVDVVRESNGSGHSQVYQLLGRHERARRQQEASTSGASNGGTTEVPPSSAANEGAETLSIGVPAKRNRGTSETNRGTAKVPPTDPKNDPPLNDPFSKASKVDPWELAASATDEELAEDQRRLDEAMANAPSFDADDDEDREVDVNDGEVEDHHDRDDLPRWRRRIDEDRQRRGAI